MICTYVSDLLVRFIQKINKKKRFQNLIIMKMQVRKCFVRAFFLHLRASIESEKKKRTREKKKHTQREIDLLL